MKILKYIEDKNKEHLEGKGERQLDMIIYQGNKHSKAIKKQEKQLKKTKRKEKTTNKKNWKGRNIRQDCAVKRQLKWHINDVWY